MSLYFTLGVERSPALASGRLTVDTLLPAWFPGEYYISGSFLSSSCLVSLVISSIGFGVGVVASAQPIHAPTAINATNATVTGVAMSQKWTSAAAPMFRKEAM